VVHKGRTISIHIPGAPHRAGDDRCDECRAQNLPVCTHQHAPSRPTPSEQQVAAHARPHGDTSGMAEHGHDTTQEPDHEPMKPTHSHAGHQRFEIKIDGQSFTGHVLRDGRFHTHELPFMMFPTAEAVARAIVNKLEWSQPHGCSQEPEKTHRS
jgi:hypothetical protein